MYCFLSIEFYIVFVFFLATRYGAINPIIETKVTNLLRSLEMEILIGRRMSRRTRSSKMKWRLFSSFSCLPRNSTALLIALNPVDAIVLLPVQKDDFPLLKE